MRERNLEVQITVYICNNIINERNKDDFFELIESVSGVFEDNCVVIEEIITTEESHSELSEIYYKDFKRRFLDYYCDITISISRI